MTAIKVKDKDFAPLIGETELAQRMDELAAELTEAYADKRPLFVAILNGAFIFAADLLRRLNFPHEISFVKVSSYHGTASTGRVKELIGISENLDGRHIIILDDILETGRTLSSVLRMLELSKPATVKICTLLIKDVGVSPEVPADYCGFRIANRFVVGYGLDYDGWGRSFPEIYAEEEGQE